MRKGKGTKSGRARKSSLYYVDNPDMNELMLLEERRAARPEELKEIKIHQSASSLLSAPEEEELELPSPEKEAVEDLPPGKEAIAAPLPKKEAVAAPQPGKEAMTFPPPWQEAPEYPTGERVPQVQDKPVDKNVLKQELGIIYTDDIMDAAVTGEKSRPIRSTLRGLCAAASVPPGSPIMQWTPSNWPTEPSLRASLPLCP
ncbi:hypothetical protein HMSSN036_32840 [Paenibacillus macerans]|nr:hypothetical protein HMSSN036_32840 [Paenibacillus macerans]